MDEREHERRVDDLGREAFERAVSQAAAYATQAVARVHRRRLVLQSALATFVISIGIALIMAFGLKAAADQQAHAEALTNCRLVTQIATPLANFVNSDATLRQRQAQLSGRNTEIGAKFSQLLGEKNYLKALAESNKLNADTVAYWQHTVIPQLRSVAGANCELRLP